MPTSRWEHISDVCHTLVRACPLSVLDIGSGCGRWGMLARDMCDIVYGRVDPRHWRCTIHGIEIFRPYISPVHKYCYDEIFIQDIREFDFKMKYDVIIAGDVIEHLPKNEGLDIIEKCMEMANKALIVGIPIGNNWKQGPSYGNENEAHLSEWNPNDLLIFEPTALRLYKLPMNRHYACAYWLKNMSFIPADSALWDGNNQ